MIMKKWLCKVCGYIRIGETLQEERPVCRTGPEFFKEVTDAQPPMAESEPKVFATWLIGC